MGGSREIQTKGEIHGRLGLRSEVCIIRVNRGERERQRGELVFHPSKPLDLNVPCLVSVEHELI